MKRIINKASAFLIAGLLMTATQSCGDDNNWKPGPEMASDNPGVYFDMNLSPQTVEINPLNPEEDHFILSMGRDRSKTGAALQVPIVISQVSDGLNIPQTVSFAAGSATAELIIEVDLDKAKGVLSYSLELDESYFNPYVAGGYNRFTGEVLVPEPVTIDNIATYIQGASVKSLEAFLNGGTAIYRIPLMSDKLDAWRNDYKTKFPAFSHYSILLPRSSYQLSVTANYSPSGMWYRGPNDAMPAQGIIPMTGTGNSPFSDVTFSIARSSTSGAPSGYNAAEVSEGAISFFNFLQEATGFTIIRDRDSETVFWFRSKADPNDWFRCERE